MFIVTPLLGGGTLVEGSDITGKTGRTILISAKWEAVKTVRAHMAASEAFDAVVTEFFAPITEAAEAAQAIAHPQKDDWATITLVEGTEFEPAEKVRLDMDGVILRMLEETDGSQLRWVGEDTLVAIA
jgi:non-ribosomal peptide synthetase component F